MDNYYIDNLSLSKDLFKEYRLSSNREDDPNKYYILDKLSKVNIFVGPNNSRKSRFVRCISSLERYEFETSDTKYNDYIDLYLSFKKALKTVLTDIRLENYAELNQKINEYERQKDIQVSKVCKTGEKYTIDVDDLFSYVKSLSGAPTTIGRAVSPDEHIQIQEKLKNVVSQYEKKVEDNKYREGFSYRFKRVYIPAIRGFRKFAVLGENQDPYENITKKEYFSDLQQGEQSSPSIFSGYSMSKNLRALILTEPENREKLNKFCNFLSTKFYKNKKVEMTPRDDRDKAVYLIIEGEDERAIQDVGDGIQQQILLFFSMFENIGKMTLFFIEEPELFMHPGMQRQFIESLYSERVFSGFQFFIATHSNHLLDITLDYENISIFRCDKRITKTENYTRIVNVDSPDHSLLASIGVKNSSVFLSNCTIWIEGVTDRMYYRHFLNLYQKYREEKKLVKEGKGFKEDLHYSFVEYGGNNITHWSFFGDDNPDVKRLCATLILIVDRDDNKGKEKRKEKIKERLGEEHFLDLREVRCREVENLLSNDALLNVVKEYEKGNTDINSSFREGKFRLERLGMFIEEEIITGERIRKSSYQDENGAINNKPAFAKKAVKYTKSYEDLSTPAKRVTEKIYRFIKSSNK